MYLLLYFLYLYQGHFKNSFKILRIFPCQLFTIIGLSIKLSAGDQTVDDLLMHKNLLIVQTASREIHGKLPTLEF